MSLYIQLTTRCNMKCSHCGFACTSRGKDMTEDIFKASLQLAIDYEDHITLGGGEPLLHPLFFKFAYQAIDGLLDVSDNSGFTAVGIVTNGKCTNEAKHLAKMAKTGLISARLSQDQYHEPIDASVIRAFTKHIRRNEFGTPIHSDDNDLRVLGSNIYNVTASGRARKWAERHPDKPSQDCFCDGIIITPDGNVWQCGCKKRLLGNVITNTDWPDDFCDLMLDGKCSHGYQIPREEPRDLILQAEIVNP